MDALIQEAKRWIAFNTVTTRSNRGFVRYLEKKFRDVGCRTQRKSYRRNGRIFCNFLASRGPRGRRPLLLSTHLDTVPPGSLSRWTSTGGRPWRAVLRAGRLFGLGTADVKLNLLCQWEALRRLQAKRFRRPVCVAGTFGEESGLLGVQRLISGWTGPRPALALVGEPSKFRLITNHRGYLVFEWRITSSVLTRYFKTPSPVLRSPSPSRGEGEFYVYEGHFTGRGAHSSTPNLGLNALEKAFDFIHRLSRSSGTVQVLGMEGGSAVNQVPAEATVRFCVGKPIRPDWLKRGNGRGTVSLERIGRDEGSFPDGMTSVGLPWNVARQGWERVQKMFSRNYSVNFGIIRSRAGQMEVLFDVRYPAGASSKQIIRRVRQKLGIISRKAGVNGSVELERNNPSLETDISRGYLNRFRLALKRAGLKFKMDKKLTCTEAGMYHRWGIPAAVWGPGRSVGNVHSPNESIAVKDLKKADAFYQNLLEVWCRPVS